MPKRKTFVFDQEVWQRHWRIPREDALLLQPIGAQLAGHGYAPDLGLTLDLNWDNFHKARFPGLKRSVQQELVAAGSSLRKVYAVLEPAVLFHELWVYQLFRRNINAKVQAREREFLPALRTICAPDTPLPGHLKTKVSTVLAQGLGVALPPLELGWTAAQRRVLERHMGRRALRGEELRGKGTYSVHKAPYWGEALRVICELAMTRTGFSQRRATILTYRVLHLLFPDVFEHNLSRPKAAEFVRIRISSRPSRLKS